MPSWVKAPAPIQLQTLSDSGPSSSSASPTASSEPTAISAQTVSNSTVGPVLTLPMIALLVVIAGLAGLGLLVATRLTRRSALGARPSR